MLLNLPWANRRLPLGEKGSLKYFTALSDGVVTRLSIIITQKFKFFIIFLDILKASIDHSSKVHSVNGPLFLFVIRIAAERSADWPWNKPIGPFVSRLLEQDAKKHNQCNKDQGFYHRRPMLILVLMAKLPPS